MSVAGRGHLVASLLLAMWTAIFIQAHRIFRQSRNTKKAKSAFLAILDKGTVGLKAAMSEEQMSQGLVTKDAMRLKRNFQLLSDSTEGMYALVDYVNFKGEGTKPSESYQGNPPTSQRFPLVHLTNVGKLIFPMSIPEKYLKEAGALPPVLLGLLEAELTAGNSIAEVNQSFPAAPVGACFQLTGPFASRPRESGDGLRFRDFGYPNFSGSFTDERGYFFLLEPPVPPDPEPDMDAIRAAHEPKPNRPKPLTSDPNSIVGRFKRSMVMDYEKWHDGLGYDLDAIAAATPPERDAIEAILLFRGLQDWRDVEALNALDTPAAQSALRDASTRSNSEILMAITRYAPRFQSSAQRTATLVSALRTAKLGGGLSEAIDEAAEYHPPEVIEALLRGALERDGETAVLFAALLLYIHQQAKEPFDWAQRPFFLRFHTEDRSAREAVFRELCAKIGINPSKYL